MLKPSHIDVSQFDGDESEDDSILEDADKVSEDAGRRLDAAPRRCTDCGWLVIFFAANCFLGYVGYDGITSGRQQSRKDLLWAGSVCNGRRSFTRGKPYLFFCNYNGTGLLLDSPICVEVCPNSSSTGHHCTVNKSGDQEWLADYPTATVQKDLCLPHNHKLRVDWAKWMLRHHPRFRLRMVWHARAAIALAVGLSIFVSCFFIFFLNTCAGYVVWITFSLLVGVPCSITAVCMYCWLRGPCAAFPDEQQHFAWITPVMGTVGVTTACILWYEAAAISKAVEVLQEASRCMFEARSLLIEPLFHMVLRVAITVGLVFIMVQLLATGQPYREGNEVLVAFQPKDKVYMVYVLFMYCWSAQLLTAVSSFAIMYVTWMWYFFPDSDDEEQEAPHFLPWRWLCRAYWLGIRYHMGTMALGALLLAVTLPIRVVMGPLVSFSYVEGNPVGFLLQQVCCCFLNVYERYFEPVDTVALMEVVINSKPWCAASRSAQKMVVLQESTVTFLNGVTRVFRMAAIGVVMYLGALVLACSYWASPKTVLTPHFVCFVTACISGVVAMPFHWAYDTVGNAVLYCWTVDYHTQEVKDQVRAQRSCMGKLVACAPLYRPGR
mmetsp:Transcript_78344/g.229624  ORF Transcript_78344/g.229624 Transcript_78344/m.229624 type:complete len:606 (+) Transcript_78344:18-1835(+)